MHGGAGNDVYFVDNTGDSVVENAGEGNDTVFAGRELHALGQCRESHPAGQRRPAGLRQRPAQRPSTATPATTCSTAAPASTSWSAAPATTPTSSMTPSDSAFESADEGNDAVFATANYGLAADVETLVLQGSGDFQGYGNNQVNTLYRQHRQQPAQRRRRRRHRWWAAPATTPISSTMPSTRCVENAGRRHRCGVRLRQLHADRQTSRRWCCRARGNLNGTGNALANSLFGNTGNNTLDGGAGADVLTGNAGNDTFVFNAGQANGDTIVDFAGNGAAAGDALLFVGYGARRDLHQHRRDPLAGQLQRRRLARHHHVHERRVDRRHRFHLPLSPPGAGARVSPSCDRRIRRSRSQTSRWSAGW